MAPIFKPVAVFLGFVLQALFVGGLGAIFFVVPFLVLLLGMVIGLRRAPGGSWRRLFPYIIILPAIWIFAGLWSGVFWYDWIHHGPRNPAWVGYPLMTAPWLSLLVSAFYLVRLSGVRLFTVCYAVVNLYFTLAMCLLGGMAITGNWL